MLFARRKIATVGAVGRGGVVARQKTALAGDRFPGCRFVSAIGASIWYNGDDEAGARNAPRSDNGEEFHTAWTRCHPCGTDWRRAQRASSASWRPVRDRCLRRDRGADVEVALEGIWELPKAAVAIARGAPVFWDAAAGNVAADIGTSNALIGGATEARGTSDLTIRVRLNGDR